MQRNVLNFKQTPVHNQFLSATIGHVLLTHVTNLLQDKVNSHVYSYDLESRLVANTKSAISLHKTTKQGATLASRVECRTQTRNVKAQTQLGTLRWWRRNKSLGANHGKEKKIEGEEKGNGCNNLGTHFPNTSIQIKL